MKEVNEDLTEVDKEVYSCVQNNRINTAIVKHIIELLSSLKRFFTAAQEAGKTREDGQ